MSKTNAERAWAAHEELIQMDASELSSSASQLRERAIDILDDLAVEAGIDE